MNRLDDGAATIFRTTHRSSKSKYSTSLQETDMRGGISFLKWAGGKGQLIHRLDSFIPQKFHSYYEPFSGGASLFFHIKKKKFPDKKCIISDTNEELINSFRVVKYHLNELIEELKKHRENYDMKGEDYYYEVRNKIKPDRLSNIQRAARFIFLNKTCWNGLYRVNSKGEFNVPSGKYQNPKIFDEKNLKQVRKLLKNTKIKILDFSEVLKFAKKEDFIYFDPPYLPVSKTSKFTDYTKSGFNEEDQKRLADVFQKLDKKGCFVMLSNSDTKLIRDLYKNFEIENVDARRMINCKKDGRGKINELLIKNY